MGDMVAQDVLRWYLVEPQYFGEDSDPFHVIGWW